MFNSSKYTNWYFSIINHAKLLNRSKGGENYVEIHHIIPRALGGNNAKANLVALTAKEHYVCHMLLPKMCIQSNHKGKMVYAFMMLSEARNGRRATHAYTGRMYERLKLSLIHI